MANLVATLIFTVGAFGLFAVTLGLSRLFGRAKKRRCACAAAREVMNQVEARRKAARKAAAYRPETVDVKNLPVLTEEERDRFGSPRFFPPSRPKSPRFSKSVGEDVE